MNAHTPPGAKATIHHGDCLAVLADLPSDSVDAVVTDPPYAVDAAPFDDTHLRGESGESCAQCLTEPPAEGFIVCSACLTLSARKDLMSAAMLGMRSQNWNEKATHSRGYADNDPKVFQDWCAAWASECHRVLKPGGHLVAFGGTRTWHRMAVAFEDAGLELRDTMAWIYGTGYPKGLNVEKAIERRLIATGMPAQEAVERAREWDGWSTTLKPAHEPILLARKAPDGTVATNVLAHRTGALHVGACTLGGNHEPGVDRRLPTNVFLDGSQAAALDQVANSGSRFFWVSKPSGRERVTLDGIAHPTVKPLDLMRELVRLVTPPGGLVFDPFGGSGTTVEACLLEGYHVVAVERDADFVELMKLRVERVEQPLAAARRRDRPDTPDLFADVEDVLKLEKDA